MGGACLTGGKGIELRKSCFLFQGGLHTVVFVTFLHNQDVYMAEKTTNDLDQKPLLHELMDHVITNSWYLLGVHLKLETKDLKAIDAEQQSINMKLCKMYELWLDTDLTATRRKLITALKRPSVSELAVADKYENMFQLTDDEGIYTL